jgi:hypothetical protein
VSELQVEGGVSFSMSAPQRPAPAGSSRLLVDRE